MSCQFVKWLYVGRETKSTNLFKSDVYGTFLGQGSEWSGNMPQIPDNLLPPLSPMAGGLGLRVVSRLVQMFNFNVHIHLCELLSPSVNFDVEINIRSRLCELRLANRRRRLLPSPGGRPGQPPAQQPQFDCSADDHGQGQWSKRQDDRAFEHASGVDRLD